MVGEQRLEGRCEPGGPALDHGQPELVHARGHDREHDPAAGLFRADPGMQQPGCPELVHLVPGEGAAGQVAPAHQPLADEPLGLADSHPDALVAELRRIGQGHLAAQRPEDDRGLGTEFLKQPRVGLAVRGMGEGLGRGRGVALREDRRGLAAGIGADTRTDPGRARVLGVAVAQAPGVQLAAQLGVGAPGDEERVPGGEGVVGEPRDRQLPGVDEPADPPLFLQQHHPRPAARQLGGGHQRVDA